MNYDKESFLAGLAVGRALWRPPERGGSRPPYLTFSSPAGEFTLNVFRGEKLWDGALFWSTDAASWTAWDGEAVRRSAGGKLHLRGTGNSVISGPGQQGEPAEQWEASGPVHCSGSIETLLDYETVLRGGHPAMGAYCFQALFMDFPLLSAPELPATALSEGCYCRMFYGCAALTVPPELPAAALETVCYAQMFEDCACLASVPRLPATALAYGCYEDMFSGCAALTALPELPAAALAERCYNCMFLDCANIRLSAAQDAVYRYPCRIPRDGGGTGAAGALDDMFYGTGGTFTGTPEINTTYYTDHAPVS